MFGITLFLIGSALSGLSQTMEQLILFRGIQGLGAGALFPISLAVIGDLFTPQERGKYQGLFGAVFGIAFDRRPAPRRLVDRHVSWHWIFYVNIPIGDRRARTSSGAACRPSRRRASRRNFDYLGGVVFTIATLRC